MSDDSPLVWKDPPPQYGHRLWDNEAIAEELRQHPGQWAVIAQCKNVQQASNTMAARKNGAVRAFRPSTDWQFQTNKCDVYARYIGGTS
jgi:hypothetical protein